MKTSHFLHSPSAKNLNSFDPSSNNLNPNPLSRQINFEYRALNKKSTINNIQNATKTGMDKIKDNWKKTNKEIFNDNNMKGGDKKGKIQNNNKKRRKGLAKYHDINKEKISIKYGERNFRIISTNMDDFRNYGTIKETDIRMNNKKLTLYVYMKPTISKILKFIVKTIKFIYLRLLVKIITTKELAE